MRYFTKKWVIDNKNVLNHLFLAHMSIWTQKDLLTVYAEKIHHINFLITASRWAWYLEVSIVWGGLILDIDFFFDGVGIFEPNIVYLSNRKKFKNESFLGR